MTDKKLNRIVNTMSWSQRLLRAARQAGSSFFTMFPVMLGTLLLSSLMIPFIPRLFEVGLFGRHPLTDALTGAGIGSLAVGQPMVSYLLGGELLSNGVGLVGVTALVVAWVTVGIAHLPVEAVMLGRRFAIYRNLLSFLFALTIAFITVGLLYVLG
ncbi:MAG: hypothetical protein ABFS45_09115 [Pseudomonadota bacterium]